jgi:large subunit ribosomal protein L22
MIGHKFGEFAPTRALLRPQPPTARRREAKHEQGKDSPRAQKANRGRGRAPRVIQASPRKVNLVAQMIRGHRRQPALSALTFSKRRAANDVKKVLQAGDRQRRRTTIPSDVDRLDRGRGVRGRSFKLKRFHARARGPRCCPSRRSGAI